MVPSLKNPTAHGLSSTTSDPSTKAHLTHKSERHKTPRYDLITSEVASQQPKKSILSLTHIYISMLRLSYFPLLWQFSIIIMILKPRPISLLLFFSKVFEKLTLKRLLPIIDTNLSDNQFDFRSNHSTIHQVHRIVDKIYYSFEKKLICTSTFLDVAQTFDKSIFTSSFYLIYKSYFEDQHLFVQYCSALSDISSIRARVSQGSVAVPLLINLYTSDRLTTNFTTTGEFANDKGILALYHDPLAVSNRIQTRLDMLSAWYRELINCPSITLNNQPLQTAQNAHYLGLYLDHRFIWAAHICNK
ncbi:hypothetical protein AGLY_012791 [Aphis glycines]|uniref:Reverse transcriptase domain-containing protein n=1 Tax=Aphis glycines TaxID=307491 RepID=A0A6G0T849_APHGL|nr:hypothetical protein AGLY_012791 [Aphis glycines]